MATKTITDFEIQVPAERGTGVLWADIYEASTFVELVNRAQGKEIKNNTTDTWGAPVSGGNYADTPLNRAILEHAGFAERADIPGQWETPAEGNAYALTPHAEALLLGKGWLRRFDDDTWEEPQNSISGNVHIYYSDKPDTLPTSPNQTLLMIKIGSYSTTIVDNAILTIGTAGTVNPHSQDGLVVNSNTRAPLGGNTPGLTTCEAGLYIPDQTTRVLNVRRGSVNVQIQWASFYFFVNSTFAV